MTTQATKEKAVKPEDGLKVPAPKTPSKTLMLSSGIALRGAALLPEKMIGILDWYFNNLDPRSGVMSIVIREDNYPKEHVGMAFPWAASMTINLQYLFERTAARLSEEPRLNLVASCWHSLLEVLLHETAHIAMAFAAPEEHNEYLEAQDAELEEAMEEMTKEIARDKLFDLAKSIDIEPPAIADMGALGAWIHAKFLAHSEDEAAMVKKTQKMLEDGLVYSDLSEDEEDYTYHKTLRSFVRHALAPEGDEGWDDGANLIQVSYSLEDGSTEVSKAQPVEEAPVIEAEPQTATATGGPTFVPDDGGTEDMDTTPDQTILEDQYQTTGFIDPNGNVEMAVVPKAQPVASDVAGEQAKPQDTMDSFQLPQQVVAAQTQATANMAAPQQQVAPPPLKDLGLSAEAIQGCMREVYMRLYATMFTRCGWSQNPTTGRFGFANLAENTKSIEIKDILDRYNAQGLIVSYLAPNENNQDTEYTVDGYVRGFVYHKTQIPAFQLTLNIGGNRVVRKLIAQNPNKITNNAYSKGAEMAGVGNAMAYVFSNADQGQPWHVRCPAKIVNNDYQIQTGS